MGFESAAPVWVLACFVVLALSSSAPVRTLVLAHACYWSSAKVEAGVCRKAYIEVI